MRIFKSIEASATGTGSESDLRGLFDDVDVNSTKLGRTVAQRNDKLVRLMQAIGDLDLSYGESSIDAYEFLMTMYAPNTGKSGGEFFTPQEVSEVRARFEPGQMIISEAEQKEFIRQFGKILRLRNILASFDDFEDDDVIGEAEFQDYRSVYVDLYAEMRRAADVEKEVVNDDLVFEIELVKQVEVGVDYVLMLVEKHREEAGDGEDKEIPVEIRRAVMSSPSLHNKRDLIEEFVHAVSAFRDVDEQWRAFIEQRRSEELAAIIRDEKLREGPAKALMEAAMRNGYVPTEGTAITRILPPTSRFRRSAGDDGHDEKKRRVQATLAAYVERFRNL